MKNALPTIFRWIDTNYKFVIVVALFLGFYFPLANRAESLENQLAKKNAEIADLRKKVDNHLIANKFYLRPASEVVPVLQEFGILK
jgi:hypothetical protein